MENIIMGLTQLLDIAPVATTPETTIDFILRVSGLICRCMKDKHDNAESLPEKGGVRPATVTNADVELTPKEEVAAETLVPPDEQLAKIEKKLEHEATADEVLAG